MNSSKKPEIWAEATTLNDQKLTFGQKPSNWQPPKPPEFNLPQPVASHQEATTSALTRIQTALNGQGSVFLRGRQVMEFDRQDRIQVEEWPKGADGKRVIIVHRERRGGPFGLFPVSRESTGTRSR